MRSVTWKDIIVMGWEILCKMVSSKHGLPAKFCILFLFTFHTEAQLFWNQGHIELFVVLKPVCCSILYVNRYLDVSQYQKGLLLSGFNATCRMIMESSKSCCQVKEIFGNVASSAALTSHLFIFETFCSWAHLAVASATHLKTKHKRSKRNRVNG